MWPDHLSPDDQAAILEELHRILASEPFRATRRCRQFLRFVVERALAGEANALKERTIAVEVFGKRHDADLERDSTVRVCARETRKRLTDYYASPATRGPFRIELPVGSYVPTFHRIFEKTENPAARTPGLPAILPRRRWPEWRFHAAVAVVALAAAALLVTSSRSLSAPLDRFWEPALRAPDGAEILVAPPLEGASSDPAPGAEGAQSPGRSARVSQAAAVAEILHFFRSRGGRAEIGDYRQIRGQEIPGKAVVVLGGSVFRATHAWLDNCPLRLHPDENPPRFSSPSGGSWTANTAQQGAGYAGIFRIPAEDSHPFLVLIAGLDARSSELAAGALVHPARAADILRFAPPGWETARLAVLVEIRDGAVRPVMARLW